MDAVFKRYCQIADVVAETFGPRCEAVVHDLSQPENSVVYVANGNVTGRAVGQSFDHLVRQVLMNKDFKEDRAVNYMFETPDHRTLRSTSLLRRDEEGNLAGMLCINVDISGWLRLQEEIGLFTAPRPSPSPSCQEEVAPDVMTMIDDLIWKIVGSQDVKNLTRKKCVELVRFMDEKGIFLVKGTVEKVAEIMGVTKVTVYSYLDEAKGKRR